MKTKTIKMASKIQRNHLLQIPAYEKAVCKTLKVYIEEKTEKHQESIWLCQINSHGNCLAITLVDYGSPEINAFPVNVCVATSIFYEDAVKISNEVLSKVNIEPKLYLQDGAIRDVTNDFQIPKRLYYLRSRIFQNVFVWNNF